MEKFKSLWISTTPQTNYPKLEKDLETDVAIVGGGLVGISTAYFLRNSGLKVAVFEAERIAEKTSGNTTAKVTVFHDLKYAFLKNKVGAKAARIYAQSNRWAIEEFERIVNNEKISCNWQRMPAYGFAETDEGLRKIKEELEAAGEAGLSVLFFQKDDFLTMKIKGGIKFEDQAIFHPRKFILAMAQILEKSGIEIFENTRIEEISESGEACRLKSSKNTIKAKKIILASNYPIYDTGLFYLRLNQMRSYALAVRTSGKNPAGMYVGVERDGLTFRPYSEGAKQWLLVGGQDHQTGVIKDDHDPFVKLEKRIKELFNVKSVDYRWSAQDSTSIDRIPFIGKMPRTQNVYLATGFGEWGMTTSLVSAKILSDLLLKRKNEWSELYDPKRLNVSASIRGGTSHVGHVAKAFSKHATGGEKQDGIELKPGEGKVINFRGKKVAAYKDETGRVHAVSPRCTHMGCILNWNRTERSWDCPCHGSRFDPDGNILNAPATKPLDKENVE